MELETSKSNYEQAQKEKEKQMDQLWTIWTLMESIQASLFKEKERTRLLEAKHWQLEPTPMFNAIVEIPPNPTKSLIESSMISLS